MWSSPTLSRQLEEALASLQSAMEGVRELQSSLENTRELLQVALDESDAIEVQACERTFTCLAKSSETLLKRLVFSQPTDEQDCFLEIHAGAGGKDAQDFARIMVMMYKTWSLKKGYSFTELGEESSGEGGGLKSITVRIGNLDSSLATYPYGWLKYERGIHRLVRISPFDSASRRHTSFASVWVYPEEISQVSAVEIDPKDLIVKTFGASGPGGQHVNKTESAVSIQHIPSGIMVRCQTERSQHRNRAQAMSMLRSKLSVVEQERRDASENALGNKAEIGWSRQCRSYILNPYCLIKDHRSGFESQDVQGILKGNLDDLLHSFWSLDNFHTLTSSLSIYEVNTPSS